MDFDLFIAKNLLIFAHHAVRESVVFDEEHVRLRLAFSSSVVVCSLDC